MAAICHQFVQNAWKKDLCSNCFKCKEEHNGGTTYKSRYLATMYPSRAHSWRAPQGILKRTQQIRRPKGSAVHFPAEESQVIGFGGGECYSSDGEDTADQDESTTGSDGEEGEEERALQKLTRTNTDYNSNLSHSGLELGKPVTDSEGKRKTLLVSVTPFEKKSFLPNHEPKDVILKSLVKHNDSENKNNLKISSKENTESLKQNDTDVSSDRNNTDSPILSDPVSDKNNAETHRITIPKTSKDNIESNSPSKAVCEKSESDDSKDTSQKSLKEKENNLIGLSLNIKEEKDCKEVSVKVMNDVNDNTPPKVINRGTVEKCKDSSIKSLKKRDFPVPFGFISSKKSIDMPFKSLKNECNSSPGSFISRGIADRCKDISLKSPSILNESNSSIDSTSKGKDEENCNLETIKLSKENEPGLPSPCVSSRNSVDKCKIASANNLKQNESCGAAKLDKNGMEKCRDLKLGECESVTKLTNKCGTESRIPIIKTRPKPAARKSYDLIKKCEVALKKVSEIKQTVDIPSCQVVKHTVDTQQVTEIATTSSQEVRQKSESLSTQEIKLTLEMPIQEVRQTVNSTSTQKVTRPLEKESEVTVPKERVELSNKLEIFTQEPNEGDTNVKSKLDVKEEIKEIVGSPDEISTKECEQMFSVESRELAGEPDGRADPDEPGEPPALPQSPPPVIDPRPSFLHGLVPVKPKIPAKPTAKLLQATPRRIVIPREEVDTLETESAKTQKRQAPKPPPVPVEEAPSTPLPLTPPVGQDKVVVKEHVPSCELESEISVPQCPEPVSRKILNNTPESDKKKASTGKGRFSLRKFLRFGGSKEDKTADQVTVEELPVPRPRLEIIHPSELNGSNVEVVGRSADESDVLPGRLTKPPPPPRNQSLAIEGFNRPARPPPPKSAELLHQQKQIIEETPTIVQPSNNLYANLGEVRSSLTPSKPQRTSSIRDCSSEGPRRRSSDEPLYECVRYKRSASLPYCSSEAGSDIYSPYSLYSDDAGDSDSGHPWKTSKLRLRKGRSVVHRSLEDNYGAVIVANHEALTQILDQVHIVTSVPPALRALKMAPNLRWTDFTVQEDACVIVGRRAFHPAVWSSQPVTLIVTQDQSLQSRGCLCPLAEFSDLVPVRFLPGGSRDSSDVVQACVGVLSRMQVDSISSYGVNLHNRLPEDGHRDGTFILLQLINALKNLQAEGVEETSLSSFALCREDRDLQPRLCVLRCSRDEVSLCKCALQALEELLPSSSLTTVLKDLLQQERAVSLSQVKSVLEFSLWGPADVVLGPDREMVLQRWLDLERATVLQGLVRSRIDLTALEECHLLFLVRTSAKTMCEASFLLDSSNPETTSF
ncbi:hypothetical protein L9F63_004738 [Diploptera punctata]|uniref:Uncharacterized protein n=1 Tax=Diploptera punctata TaxID=6984 RepID=A0AAD8E725_DIPPU|nr:hypothetical protein L9F63_004738 [Diploptera punctata]